MQRSFTTKPHRQRKYELQNEKPEDITPADLQTAWEKLGIAKWEDTYSSGLIPNVGLTDICEIVRASGFDVDSWLQKIAAQQSAEMMKAEQISVRRYKRRQFCHLRAHI